MQLTSAEQALGVTLPHRRMEEWRWTDLRSRLTKPYGKQHVSATEVEIANALAAAPFGSIAKYRLVFVNGDYSPAHSVVPTQGDIEFTAHLDVTRSKARNDGPLSHLNRKLDPATISLRFETNTNETVELIHIATDATPRGMAVNFAIDVADGACASIIETYLGQGDYVLSANTHLRLGDGAKLDRVKLQMDGEAASHLSQVTYDLGAKAQLNDVTITIGGALTRQNGNCNFGGEFTEAKISGAYLQRAKQHVDTALVINHAVPHCTSRELFKCVMDEQARGIFQGKVKVAKYAQKTDGKQSSHALLLSETAEFDAKPELEIYADDVVCGHGATAGDLNHDYLFYLQSRGIPMAEAKSLLIAAFVGETFDLVANEEVREVLTGLAEKWVTR